MFRIRDVYQRSGRMFSDSDFFPISDPGSNNKRNIIWGRSSPYFVITSEQLCTQRKLASLSHEHSNTAHLNIPPSPPPCPSADTVTELDDDNFDFFLWRPDLDGCCSVKMCQYIVWNKRNGSLSLAMTVRAANHTWQHLIYKQIWKLIWYGTLRLAQ